MWSDSACVGDRNLYFNATASVEGRSAIVKSSPTQGEEKGPAPLNVTTGDGFTERPSVFVTAHLDCKPTTVAVVGIGTMVAIPRDAVGDLSEEEAVKMDCQLDGGDPSRVTGCCGLTAKLGTRRSLWTSWQVRRFCLRDGEPSRLLETDLSASNEDRRGHDGGGEMRRTDEWKYLCEGLIQLMLSTIDWIGASSLVPLLWPLTSGQVLISQFPL